MEFEELYKSPLGASLSDFGKEIFMPQGIFYWAGRAKNLEFNGTAGTAKVLRSELNLEGEGMVSCYLGGIEEYVAPDKTDNIVNYAPINGIPKFRELWKQWIIAKSPNSIDVSNKLSTPAVTNGITMGIFAVARMFLNANEKIIVPNKRWGNYDLILTKQLGVGLEIFEFFKEKAFNVDALDQAIQNVADAGQEKIVLIVNFPNNPTGYAPTEKEILAIKEMLIAKAKALEKPIVVICDDAYEGYVYDDGRVPESIFYHLVDVNKWIVPIKLDGISKEMLLYGGRIGAITFGFSAEWGNAEALQKIEKQIDNKFQGLIRSTISNCNHLMQEILVEILEKGPEHVYKMRQATYDLLSERYYECLTAINELNNPNITMDPAGGGFFLFLNIKDVDATELADLLVTKYSVGLIPIVKPEGGVNGLRVAYCSVPKPKIKELFSRIDQACRELASK